jgi:hypothetical protein
MNGDPGCSRCSVAKAVAVVRAEPEDCRAHGYKRRLLYPSKYWNCWLIFLPIYLLLTLLPLTAASLSAGVCMYFTPYLDDFDVDPETKRVLVVALEKTRVALGHNDDFANGIIAKRIIEIAETGERNPDLLCEGTLNKLRQHLYGD